MEIRNGVRSENATDPDKSFGGRPEVRGTPPARRRWLWVVVAAVVLVAGVCGSIAGAVAWDHYQQDQARRSFDTTASTVAASTTSALRRDLDFGASMQALLATLPSVTNQQVAAGFDRLHVASRYPGTLGFAYVEPVALAQLPSFIAALQADPPHNLSVVPYQIYPPGVRSEYCLIRLAIQLRASPLPAGIDFCSPSPALLQQVTSAGKASIFSFSGLGQVSQAVPQSFTQALKRLFVVIEPVYHGSMPNTAAGRQAAVAGWVVGTYSSKALVDAALGSTSGIKVTVRYHNQSGKAVVIGTGGSISSGPHLTANRPISTNGSLNEPVDVVVTGTGSTVAFIQGLLLGIIGIALTLALSALLLYLARSRQRALRMVEHRTGQLRHQALHDPLTDLPNRALLFDRAQQMLARAERGSSRVGAIYIDLDNFKDINDTFGHETGDLLLRGVANRLSSALRASDTVGRIGGDEFLVLAEGDVHGAGPEMVAERLQSVMSAPFVVDGDNGADAGTGMEFTVRASIGVAIGSGGRADDLIRDADVALYQAKGAGKDRYVMFRPEMQRAVRDRLDLEMDLHHALERDQLYLVYQPIFDLNSVKVKGVEALLRWRHPTKGVLAPGQFVPLAEEIGLIVPIGRFVLDQACAQAAQWHADGHRIGMAVNVSPRQLSTRSFVDDVSHALAQSNLEPGYLTLEITESTIMENTEAASHLLRDLKALGVRISIDDFGTGYSSLSYLRQFPIDALKIDRSFITRVSQTSQSGALIHTLIQLGKALGIETLAEGIEEESQLDRLQREQCDSGQGFLFARPMEAEKILPFFSDERAPGGQEPSTGNGARGAAEHSRRR